MKLCSAAVLLAAAASSASTFASAFAFAPPSSASRVRGRFNSDAFVVVVPLCSTAESSSTSTSEQEQQEEQQPRQEEAPPPSSSSSSSSSDFASAVPAEPTIYEKLGIEEDDLAVGLDPEEVLEYLGTRDNLVAKFQRDNKSFTPERASTEVDRFLMDAEMADAFIEYEKRKRTDPQSIRDEAEANLSDPSTWATYAAWIGGGFGFAALKNLYVEPKFASGEWTDVHIGLPTPDMILHSPVAESATAAAGDVIGHTVDPAGVQSTVEGVAGAVSDALTKCVGEACP